MRYPKLCQFMVLGTHLEKKIFKRQCIFIYNITRHIKVTVIQPYKTFIQKENRPLSQNGIQEEIFLR